MSHRPSGRRTLVVAALLALSAVSAQAQVAESPATQPTKADSKVEKIEVKALPLDAPLTDLARPVTVVRGEDLHAKRAASIGDTLAGELGVHSSAFGPGAGRPIIRGLDGPRVRVLENGVGTLDVSTLSPDHMVTTDAAYAEQIEILRGPASLLYGSGAIGGVVNVVSNLVPSAPQNTLSGEAELRAVSGNRGRSASASLSGGNGDLAWHLDGFRRQAKDYRIPGRAVKDDPDSASGRLPGSDVDTEGAGLGASFTRSTGYFGAGVSGLRNTYGLPTGEGTFIKLKQNRVEVAGESLDPLAGIERIRLRAARGDYEHSEIEPDGAVATTFKNKGDEGRIEARHVALGGWKGAFGVQWQDRDASALGEEAYLPPSTTRALGIFLVEEKTLGNWTLSLGARSERERLSAEGDLPARRFTLASFAMGATWKFAPDLALSLNLSRAERAASAEELYSFGPHLATATFDVGDAALGKESSRNLDLTLAKTRGAVQWKVNIFSNRMRNYIFGRNVDEDGDGLPDRVNTEGELEPDGELLLQRLGQADARFTGYEAEVAVQNESWKLRAFTDRVRARLSAGGNLPRISPGRFGIEALRRIGPWSAGVNIMRVQSQSRLAALETPTAGYTNVNAEVTYATDLGGVKTLVFLRGQNLADREIRLHTSYLKDVVPQPGRSFALGVRATF